MSIVNYIYLCLIWSACTPTHIKKNNEFIQKVHIQRLPGVNDKGLYGPPNGLVSLSYEFCIPREQKYIDEIKSIDTTVQISKSSGRIGCSKDQYLCLGHTAQENYLQVLEGLARKEYIHRIEEAWFE